MSSPQTPGPQWDGQRWVQWNGRAWEPMPGQPPPPPGGRRDGWSTRAVVLLVVGALLFMGLGAGLVFLLTRSDGTATPSASGSASASTSQASDTQNVVLLPLNSGENAYTPAVGNDLAVTPVTRSAPAEVPGGQVGLYGGTLDLGSCDRTQLVGFLQGNPDKGAAWAGVQGIEPADIEPFVLGLTALILRSDTLVTNHGYRDGAATSFTSVLQAGTAVLINDHGLPVVRCYCGNPLTPPPALTNPVYDGPSWQWWQPASITVIVVSVEVIEEFTVIDLATGKEFIRPAGTAGPRDTPAEAPTTAPTTTAPPTTAPPSGEPVTVFAIESIMGISNGPSAPSRFTLDTPVYVTSIMTYHYDNGGRRPGTIGLRARDGTVYGPWPAKGTPGQGGVPNAYWTATPNEMIPAGTYDIVDADPSTWSWASDTDGRGITVVMGIPTGR